MAGVVKLLLPELMWDRWDGRGLRTDVGRVVRLMRWKTETRLIGPARS